MSKASLNELMGSGGSKAESRKLTLDDLGEILGERMPKLEFSPRGRMRLQNALTKRFGDDFRNLPGISDIIKEFDDNAKFEIKKNEMKLIKARR